MKEIYLSSKSKDKFAIVDDDDYEWLSTYRWYFTPNNRSKNTVAISGYATTRIDGKTCLMHRMIWEKHYGEIPKGQMMDHISRDKLDNRKPNFRLVTKGQNMMNHPTRRDNSVGYRGVWKTKQKSGRVIKSGEYREYKRNRPYQAYITIDDKRISLGMYSTAEEAAYVRDQVALQIHGVYSWLNYPELKEDIDGSM